MIAFLTGKIAERNIDNIVLSVGGVGYEVHISSKTAKEMASEQEAGLFIYTYVREDTLKLFGFSRRLEKQIFLSLIGINGIGPKMAMVLLSAVPSLKEFLVMIEEEDIKSLSRLPRVGKKSAQQMVLALKGQLQKGSEEPLRAKTRRMVTTGLLNLGFRAGEVQLALEQVTIEDDVEEGVKKALSYLSQTGKTKSLP